MCRTSKKTVALVCLTSVSHKKKTSGGGSLNCVLLGFVVYVCVFVLGLQSYNSLKMNNLHQEGYTKALGELNAQAYLPDRNILAQAKCYKPKITF